MPAFVEGLVCRDCGSLQSDMERRFRCASCNGFLEARYDLTAIRRHLDRAALASRRGGVWRFRELLPVRDDSNIVSLKEGGTPLLRSRRIGPALGMTNLYFKDLTRNPTYSFKDYSSTVSISKAKEIGVQDEAGAASRAGVEFWRFPIADRDVPADEGAAVAFARKAWARVSANGSVVIHCRMGIGRSSVMAALALVVGGVPVVRAWQQLSMAREMVVPDTFEQKAWVDRVAKRLADGELQ